ncbi:heavy-metal-associated domain-containing protein [bacterium]|nr:heavy-metal-associated domain-containing protein [bacterium]NCQ55128.1 heavy-metal-associated domain-containing protein [Candidatus Parcubacteria bacterium]NCS67359.1 heavy-metal-associated domain-containing protein [Candidatus Peregrinibacteria bacterium]NCS96614.1 heavy-metal-associated domain-containing protein [bacterium]
MEHHHQPAPKTIKTYWPLILVLAFIASGTFYLSWVRNSFDASNLMLDFMGLFFVAFAFFKLLDVPAFASAYRSYDIPTKLWPTWGYVYPFLELAFGVLLLYRIELFWTNLAIVVVLGVSIVGVIQSVLKKREIKCACLGTGFNLPMSQVTIIEDGLMILMALWMLY